MARAMRWAVIVGMCWAFQGLTAQAGDLGACGNGWGYWGYYPPSTVVQERIPYFAQHPPVYYSYPIPRSYGYSPYAYPPGVMTPDVPLFAPEVIPAPTPAPPKPQATPSRLTAGPLRIINPYFEEKDDPFGAEKIALNPRPQVVYPMQLGN
jgi:hypothetical protein